MQSMVWQGLDAPRMEVARVERDGDRLRARGTQIGVVYELRYELEEPRLRLELVGARSLELELEDGRDHFDLGYSPLFNSSPVIRYGLHRGGESRDFVMTLVSVPSLEVERSEQRYEPFAPGLVRFRSGDFTAMLELDEDGFVVRYPGLATRLD
jgi:uncharacterized protein